MATSTYSVSADIPRPHWYGVPLFYFKSWCGRCLLLLCLQYNEWMNEWIRIRWNSNAVKIIAAKRAAGEMKDPSLLTPHCWIPHFPLLKDATYLQWNFLHCYVFYFFFYAAHGRVLLVAYCNLMYDWFLRVIYLSSIMLDAGLRTAYCVDSLSCLLSSFCRCCFMVSFSFLLPCLWYCKPRLIGIITNFEGKEKNREWGNNAQTKCCFSF